MGKAAIYNPYLDTLGGGEKYTISLAKVLSEDLGYDVDIEWKDQSIKSKLVNRFGLKIPNNINFLNSVNRGEGYDICFWVSDGSIPILRAKRNYIHFQVPFHDVNGKTLLNKMKLFRIEKVICNSVFTKNIIDKEYGVNSIVLYPPVDTSMFRPKRKENVISYVGRFSNLVQTKGHETLIKVFKKLVKDKKYSDWKLILAGGSEVGADKYVGYLRKLSKDTNIEIVESPNYEDIVEILGKSKFFWSAAGYNVDSDKSPEKMEHFGITLVEAMSSGSVPIAFNGGGHVEIIEDGKSGYLWNNTNELVQFTKKIINESHSLKNISINAQQRSKIYSYEEFKKRIKQII